MTILYTYEHNPPRPLEGCRVVDFSTGLAGPYCTRLFAAAGAEVIKVEPPDGDPMRRWSASGTLLPEGVDSAMFRFLNEGKHGLVGRSGDPDVDEMVAAADVVVESFVPAQLKIAALRDRFPGLVVVSLTPFGRTGPWRDRLASDFTIDAEGAAIATLGRRDGLPVRMGVRITEYIAGVYAAVAALAAWQHAREAGAGETIDLSIAETANATVTGLLPMGYELDGRPAITEPARWVEVPGVEPTADSWVGLTVMSRQQFDDLLVMIDRSDLIGNEDWPKLFYRSEHIDEWRWKSDAMNTEGWNRPSWAPGPVVVAMNEGMWSAAAEGRLDLQRCTGCGTHRYPPDASCRNCGSIKWEWSTLPGTGTVYTYSWVPDRRRSAEQGSEVFYNVAVIDLDGVEGGPVRMMSNVVDAWERDDLDIGQLVEVVAMRLDDDVSLPCFRRVR